MNNNSYHFLLFAFPMQDTTNL